jgi:hypothetical protein
MRFIHRIAAIALLAAFTVSASAQAPSFRSRGYKGNVGIQTFELMPGILTSHGYMFNGHHYLGAGVGFTVIPSSDLSIIVSPFIEYQAYILPKNSTPVVGVRLEHLMVIDETPIYYAAATPTFGWSWGIGSQKQFGIMPFIGCGVFYQYTGPDRGHVFPFPMLGVVFEI